MGALDFIKKLYNGKNCYSDHMELEDLKLLHIESAVESIIAQKLSDNKIIFITGNPGDGKTFIIKSIKSLLDEDLYNNIYIETDLNTIGDYSIVANRIIRCVNDQLPALIAVNEYPFFQLKNVIRDKDKEIARRISISQRSSIIYGTPMEDIEKQILVIDLNERNILETGPDGPSPLSVLEKMCELLNNEGTHNQKLDNNIRALSHKDVKIKLLELVKNATINSGHFAVRDILGAFAFVLTSCLEDDDPHTYSDAIFIGNNPFLRAIQQFDPIYLTSPELDEALWNGEESVLSNWLFGPPSIWPNDSRYDEDRKGALELFKAIKRKYYFENSESYRLSEIQLQTLDQGRRALKEFSIHKKELKQSIIRGLNRLFLPTSTDRRHLQIWVTHKYDLSNETATVVSKSYVDANKLEVVCPEPIDWLKGMEYTPNHIVLRPKNKKAPRLVLDVDFMRILELVDKGYPMSLLPSHFVQTASNFLQKLDDAGLTEDNDEDEIIIANRKSGFQMKIMIENNKYFFE